MWRKTVFLVLFMTLLLFNMNGLVRAATGKTAVSSHAITLVAPEVQDEGGRTITRQDWVDHIPLMIVMIIIVLAVDAIFIAKIIKDRRQEQANS